MWIRTLNAEDGPAWWTLRLESLESEPLAFGKSAEEHRATPVETISARFRDVSPANLYLGAFEDGVLVGMSTFLRETGEKERHKARIYGVYVSAAHRGKGAARTMLTETLAFARRDPTLEQVLLAVASSQTAAKTLYRSLGFEIFGVEPRALKVGSSYVDEEHMILRLGRVG